MTETPGMLAAKLDSRDNPSFLNNSEYVAMYTGCVIAALAVAVICFNAILAKKSVAQEKKLNLLAKSLKLFSE